MEKEGVSRFVKPQRDFYRIVESELKSGKKETHWMWFMFPQLKGLGSSGMSCYYGIDGLEEAKEYMSVPFLRKNLIKLTNIVIKSKEDIEDMFGWIDAKKFHSCMTLFYKATGMRVFKKALDTIFDGLMDNRTMVLLSERERNGRK